MATQSFLPDTLDLVFVKGDKLVFPIDLGINLTGYTFESWLTKVVSMSGGYVVSTLQIAEFTRTNVNLSTGKINLSLDSTVTGALELGEKYRWYFRMTPSGGGPKTALTGAVDVRNP